MSNITKEEAFDFIEYMRQTMTITYHELQGWIIEDLLGNKSMSPSLLDAIAAHKEKLSGKACRIFGAEDVSFQKYVPLSEIKQTCLEIWNHPDRFDNRFQADTEDAYYRFLKYLWVTLPNGNEIRLADIVYKLETGDLI